jgi:aryl-alcohol dehydrogenase-like predicted oxidoreductase
MLSRVKLANTDLTVSQLCYGTAPLGTEADQDRANLLLDTFIELGGNFIDTARMYGDWVPDSPPGPSERAIGAWLKQRGRGDLVIATKGGGIDMRVGDWRSRVTPEDLNKDLNESLAHLGIDTIDLYWLHADDLSVPVGPIMDALFEHQAANRIRYMGASNWTPERIVEANKYAQSRGKQGFVAAQPFWGLALPNEEKSNPQGYVVHYEGRFEQLHAAGLTMIPYNGQSSGYFTKRSEGGMEAVPERLRERYDNSANTARLAAVEAIATKHGVSINEVVLAYLVSQPHQTIPIFGSKSPEQMRESIRAASLKLTAEELAQLRTS